MEFGLWGGGWGDFGSGGVEEEGLKRGSGRFVVQDIILLDNYGTDTDTFNARFLAPPSPSIRPKRE